MHDALESSKIDRNDFALWDTLKIVEGQPIKWNGTIKNHASGKELTPKNNTHNSRKRFSEALLVSSRHRNRHSVVIRKIQFKSTVRLQFPPIISALRMLG